MQYGCCQWCLTIVKAPEHYDRMQHWLYCSQDCYEKDWLFRKWQNNRYLDLIAKEFVEKKGGTRGRA